MSEARMERGSERRGGSRVAQIKKHLIKSSLLIMKHDAPNMNSGDMFDFSRKLQSPMVELVPPPFHRHRYRPLTTTERELLHDTYLSL